MPCLHRVCTASLLSAHSFLFLTDVDECTAGSNTCDDNAECHDTDGSYWCQCLPGYQGDGYDCTSM